MLLKKLDSLLSILGVPAAYLLRSLFFYRIPKKKSLIIRPGGMGDLIALTQTMRELEINYSDFHFLIEKRSETWAKYLELNYTCYDETPLKTLFNNCASYEKVINTEQRFGLSQIYALACKSPEGSLTSFDTNKISLLAHDKVEYDAYSTHEVVAFGKIFNPSVHLNNFISQAANQESNYSVAWIAGGNSPSRTMAIEDFEQMLSHCKSKQLYIVAAPVDKDFAQKLQKKVSEKFEKCEVVQGTFIEACELLKNAFSLFTVDSGPVHIASFFRVKTYTIFTSGILKKWHPLTRGSYIFRNKEVKCAPCTLFGQVPPCPNNYQCKTINFSSPEKVEETIPHFH